MTAGVLRRALYAACVLALWNAAGFAQPLGSGVFHKVGAVEAQLARGASTKGDVQALLGVPNGTGASLFPVTSAGRVQSWDKREIWYYEDIEADLAPGAGQGGAHRLDIRTQILLVFFKGELFDGYFWTSNTNPAQPW